MKRPTNDEGEDTARRLSGHDAEVYRVAFRPRAAASSRASLASASFDRTVRLWDVGSGKVETTLSGHEAKVLCVGWNPKGTKLATGGGDKTVRLWTDGGELEATFEGHEGDVYDVAFVAGSDDSSAVASASADGSVRLWTPAAEEPARTLKGHEKSVYALAADRSGRTLASGGLDGAIVVWDATSGLQLKRLEGHTDGVFCLAISNDGSTVFSGSSDHTVRRWNVETGKEIGTPLKHPHWVCAVALSGDGSTVLTADYAGQLIATSSRDGRTLWKKRLSQVVYHAALSADGRSIATANRDRTISLLQVGQEDVLDGE